MLKLRNRSSTRDRTYSQRWLLIASSDAGTYPATIGKRTVSATISLLVGLGTNSHHDLWTRALRSSLLTDLQMATIHQHRWTPSHGFHGSKAWYCGV
ncbi:hypothetical protein BDN72DRAFT_662563 [Pluteus cervinus]|uniref:Uncharacterized protein n=1 Tax=Pluteus cervinus TaxID=181527 RepID=A0ACD3ASX0_9AGAR|nr:hypothetical protein BDN72DRAFT_662563 [Pluteus cervinus]